MSNIKAIVVGAYGLFLESLITRLKKEAWETFVITGKKSKDREKHSGVVEDYYFEYDNDNIQYIFESIKPDVVIFTGALDPNFAWKDQSDAVTYIGAINNMLLSATKAKVKRFIYLSDTDVYNKMQTGIIMEDSPVNPVDFKDITIKNGEDISIGFERDGMDVVVLRCSEVYGIKNNKINMQSYCTKLSLQILEDEIPKVDPNKKHDCIHVDDVVDAVYRTITKDVIPSKIYNICSSNAVTEEQLLKMVNQLLYKDIEVKFTKESFDTYGEYSNDLAVKELGFFNKKSFLENFRGFVKQLAENKSLEITKKKEGNYFSKLKSSLQLIFGWFSPYFETIIAFIFIHIISILTYDSLLLGAVDFYLLYVVFISIIHGKWQTITALLLSFLGKIILAQQNVSFMRVIVDYKTYIWVLQLLIIGMAVGYIRDHYRQSINDNKENIKYLEAELAEIKAINQSNIRLKKIFENRIVNYQDSFARIYSIVTKLDDLEPDKIMFAAIEVVEQIMGSEDIVIYNVDNGSPYARLIASSVNSTHGSSKSIKLDSVQYEEIYDEIKKHNVYINRTIDNNKPSMAGGVFHEDTLESVVMIWSLPFENTTLYHMNLFSVVLNLITQATHRANLYIEESHSRRYLDGTNIFTEKAFQNILEINKTAYDNKLADYHILEIINEDKNLKELNDIIVPIARQNDYLGLLEKDKLYLLLTNTNKKEAQFVIKRLGEKGITFRKDVYSVDGE